MTNWRNAGDSQWQPDCTTPLGEALWKHMKAWGMTAEQLALRTGIPVGEVMRLLNGSGELLESDAQVLEDVLLVPAQVWLRLSAKRLAEADNA